MPTLVARQQASPTGYQAVPIPYTVSEYIAASLIVTYTFLGLSFLFFSYQIISSCLRHLFSSGKHPSTPGPSGASDRDRSSGGLGLAGSAWGTLSSLLPRRLRSLVARGVYNVYTRVKGDEHELATRRGSEGAV